MADGVVTFLLGYLEELLVKEANLLSGVEDKITSLHKELKLINIFLKNSEGKRNEHEIVKEVVSQIRDVAHEAEDVIDTFIANVIIRKRRNKLERIVHTREHLTMLHDVAVKIEKIRGTISDIYNNKIKYDIAEGESTPREDGEAAQLLHRWRRDVAKEEEVVGFVKDSNVVIKQLMEGGSGRNIVSIIGMGGLGKTTLARKIYNDNQVKKLFPCRAWAYVSTDFRPRELLLSLLKCLLSTPEYNDLFKRKEGEAEDERPTTSEEELKKLVRKCLNRKKYLVVLDDIWEPQVWDEVKAAFPDDNYNGSRILLTSRKKEVALHTSEINPPQVYYLPFLNKNESWELFSKKVFRGAECPSDLEHLGKLIAQSCGGLPLAIVVLAGLLRRKEKSERVWSEIKGHVIWFLGQEKPAVRDILKLGYDNLPRRLKPCFLYFGIYPEDYEIPVRQLIRLWIAEGLIQETGTRSLEGVGEYYLEDLVDRSLVQVASKRTDGGFKTCRIHDLLRDLCIEESKDDKFFEVCTEINILTKNSPRRLSLHGTLFHFSSTPYDHSESGTRSLFCFGQEAYEVKSIHWKWLLKTFKLARVLNLGRINVNSIPSDLEKLVHLKYLRIDSQRLQTIPASICSLWNLETLDLRGSTVNSFSRTSELWQLKRLRHLYMCGPVKLTDLRGSDSRSKTTMPNLQTLSTVALDSQTMSLVERGRFPQLRKLGLYYEQHDKCKPRVELQALHHLRELQTLKIIGTSELPSLAYAFTSNLTKITLKLSVFFNTKSITTLERLTKLKFLKLSAEKDHNTFNLSCSAGGFLQLREFQMVGINVKEWRLENGSMPRLERLAIKDCKFLIGLPKQLWSSTTLHEVQVWWPSPELANNMAQNSKENEGCKLIIYPLSTKKESDSV